MNSQQAFELVAAACEEGHKSARAAQAISECVALPDIETCELEALQDAVQVIAECVARLDIDTCELEALQAAVAAELEDRDVDQKFRNFVHAIHRMSHEQKSTGTINHS